MYKISIFKLFFLHTLQSWVDIFKAYSHLWLKSQVITCWRNLGSLKGKTHPKESGCTTVGVLDQLPLPLKCKGLVIWTNPKAESFVWQTAASRSRREDLVKTWEVHNMVFRAQTSKMPKLLRKETGEYIFRMSGLCCYHKDHRQGTLQKEANLTDDLGSLRLEFLSD